MPRPPDRLHLPWRREAAVRARTLWADVRRPRTWRAIGATLLVVSSLMAAYNAGPGQCINRTRGREDTRALGVGMVDEVADYAQVPAVDRAELERRAVARARRELPPPDCWAWPAP